MTSDPGRTHYADEATLARLAQLEGELAAACELLRESLKDWSSCTTSCKYHSCHTKKRVQNFLLEREVGR